MIVKSLQHVGAITLHFMQMTGHVTVFAFSVIGQFFTPPYYPKTILKHLVSIGYYSLPVVGLTAIFTGAVLALQSYTGFSRFNAESSIAAVVVISITRELGPVLAGLMVAGRVGASTAAEIGTMRVTEQIDALITLSTHPFKYLIGPRIIAGVIMLPFLVLIADIIGVYGGYLVSIHKLGFSEGSYLTNTFQFLESKDVISGLIKASIFGFIITLMACYQGFYCGKGADGVGRATINAVVASSMLILLSNYFATEFFFSK